MLWFRWYHGTCTDPKLAAVARVTGAPRERVIAVWAMVLENASSASDRGRVSVDADGIAETLGCDSESVAAILRSFTKRKLIERGRVANWERRQPPRDNSLERVRRHREKEKPVTPVTRYSNARNDVRAEQIRADKKREEANSNTRPVDEELVSEIIRTLNRGMNDNPRLGNHRPVDPTGPSRQDVIDWLEDGIDPETIKLVVYEKGRSFTPTASSRQISTLKYCNGAVRREWEAVKARGTPAPSGDLHGIARQPAAGSQHESVRNRNDEAPVAQERVDPIVAQLVTPKVLTTPGEDRKRIDNWKRDNIELANQIANEELARIEAEAAESGTKLSERGKGIMLESATDRRILEILRPKAVA